MWHSLVLAFMLGQLYNLIDMTDVIAEFWLNEIDFKSQFWCNANPTNQAAQVLLTLISSICHRIEIWLFFSLSSLLSQINKCWYLWKVQSYQSVSFVSNFWQIARTLMPSSSLLYQIQVAFTKSIPKKKDTKCKTSNCNVNRTKSWNRKTVRSFVENSIRFELDLDLTRFQYTCMNTNAQHKCVFMSRWELFFYSFDVLVFFFFFFDSPFSFSSNNLRNSSIFLLVDDLKCFCDCAFSFYFILFHMYVHLMEKIIFDWLLPPFTFRKGLYEIGR